MECGWIGALLALLSAGIVGIAAGGCAESHRLDDPPIVGPDFLVTFPTPNANLGGIPEITIAGRASRNVQAGSILVNGQTADRPDGESSRWSARIPVTIGEPNDIEVTARVNGTLETIAFTVDNQVPVYGATDLALDVARNRALVLLRAGIVAVDLDTGRRTLLELQGGTALEDATNLAVDSANDRAFILDRESGLLALDLETPSLTPVPTSRDRYMPALGYDPSTRRVLLEHIPAYPTGHGALELVDPDTGDHDILPFDEDTFGIRSSIAVDAEGTRAFAVAGGRYNKLFSVSPRTGDRELFIPVPLEELCESLICYSNDVALDAATGRLLVAATDPDVYRDPGTMNQPTVMVIAVNLATKDQVVLTQMSAYGWFWQGYIALDAASRRAVFMAQAPSGATLYSLDPDTGEHAILSDNRSGDGPALSAPRGVAYEPANNGVLVSQWNSLLSVDLRTANRTVLSDSDVWSGSECGRFHRLALRRSHDEALVVGLDIDPTSSEFYGSVPLMRVDLGTGDCSVVTPRHEGRPALDVTLDEGRDTAFLVNPGTVYATDPETDESSPLASSLNGWPCFRSSIALDPQRDRLLVALGGEGGEARCTSLIAVDRETGEQQVVSDRTTGTGPPLAFPMDLAVDAMRDHAVVLDRLTLVSVDLQSGDRTVLSGPGTGLGLRFYGNSIELDTSNRRAFVTSSRTLWVVDLPSGDRAIAAQ